MKKSTYSANKILDKLFGGHITIGKLTIYGRNAMHFAVHYRLKNTIMCFRLPLFCFGRWWPLYFYLSPNGTPSSATFSIPKVVY